ncbi:hypothetical protein [uncultured Winogradskyella sp.]|uniref:TolB family protein n=1 Tax=uncultured Winogradskyella sp. TaxID=395353 RepID=UPI00260580E9|nr:hypothetical protein [uncultured Winogradskyella sp.]
MKRVSTIILSLIANLLIAQSDFSPQYSNDGNQILFYSYRIEKEPEIFIINKDGKQVKQLTKTDGNWAIEPRWSENDDFITYSTGENMGKLRLAIHNLNKDEVKFIEKMEGTQFVISWNKNGIEWANKGKDGFKFYRKTEHDNKLIEYKQFKDYFLKSSRDGEFTVLAVNDENKKGLWVVKNNGEPKKLTDKVGSNISFSFDNTFIAFEYKENETSNIYTVKLDGTHLQQVTSDKADDLMPTISPSGKEITFSSSISGQFCLHTINLDNKKIKQITGLNN